MIGLKLKNNGNISAYIAIIRKFDRNELFCKLLQTLEAKDAEIELYDDAEEITTEMLYNMIESWNQICMDTECDIERELGI